MHLPTKIHQEAPVGAATWYQEKSPKCQNITATNPPPALKVDEPCTVPEITLMTPPMMSPNPYAIEENLIVRIFQKIKFEFRSHDAPQQEETSQRTHFLISHPASQGSAVSIRQHLSLKMTLLLPSKILYLKSSLML